jgi:hypothetical protein
MTMWFLDDIVNSDILLGLFVMFDFILLALLGKMLA